MHIKVEGQMSTEIPTWAQCDRQWFNTDTTLWDVSSDSPILLTSEKYGYIGIGKVYGEKDEIDHVLLQGRLPKAGPYLVNALNKVKNVDVHLEVRHSECGTPDDYEIQDLLCRITDIEVVERQIPDIVIISPDDIGLVVAYALLKGKIEWFWKGQET